MIRSAVSRTYVGVYEPHPQPRRIAIRNSSKAKAEFADDTACLVVQQPNFFGYMEEMQALSENVHPQAGLFVVYADPMAMAMLKPPGVYDADVVAAAGHALRVPSAFGGTYVAIFAC